MGRVGERSQDIENGADTDFAACRPDVLHCWMIGGREHKTEANLSYAMRNLLGSKIDFGPQRFQHISAPAAACCGAIAMLGYRHSCCRSQDSCACRDVESACAIASSAAGVQGAVSYLLIQLHADRLIAHHSRQPCKLFNRLAARTQA